MALPEAIKRNSIKKLEDEAIQEQHKVELVNYINKMIKLNESLIVNNSNFHVDISSNVSSGISIKSINEIVDYYIEAGWECELIGMYCLNLK